MKSPMNKEAPSPPRWAEAMLRSLLRPSDRESISGDLLEEYRAARHPKGGALCANAWYVTQVFSVLWQLIQPCAWTIAGLTVFLLMFRGPSLAVRSPWNLSLVPAPAISLLHCVIYLWAASRSSWRTRLIRTGIVAAGASALFAFVVTFAFLALETPGLVAVAFSKPFIFVILTVCLLLALAHGVVMGIVGASPAGG